MENSLTSSSASVWDNLKGGITPQLHARTLPRGFYGRKTVIVAQELLGKVLLVRSRPSEIVAARIIETEAYSGDDPVSHSARGETPRCSIMFGEAGFVYVYFIYGMYQMLNFVTESKGYPGAVLIRALEPLSGIELMRKRRKIIQGALTELTAGPGRLSEAMGIKLTHKGESLTGPIFRVIDDGFRPDRISASPRVGISEAKERMWRYFITNSPFVSKAPQNSKAKILRGDLLNV